MLSPTMQSALNDQIQMELSSAYVYLAMSAHFEDVALPGCAGWMKHQAQEEMEHAMRLYTYVFDRGGRVVLQALPAPPAEFGAPKEVFEQALGYERKVTASIHDLYRTAVKEDDLPTQSHLQWFIDEQVEEEKTASEIVDLFARAGEHEPALLMIDNNLARRGPEESA